MNFDAIEIESKLTDVVGIYGLHTKRLCNHFNTKFGLNCGSCQIKNASIYVIGFGNKKFNGEIHNILLDFESNKKYVEIILSSSTVRSETIFDLIDTISEVFDDFIFVQELKIVQKTKINIAEIEKLNMYIKRYEL